MSALACVTFHCHWRKRVDGINHCDDEKECPKRKKRDEASMKCMHEREKKENIQ
jgi:hypothetical protein